MDYFIKSTHIERLNIKPIRMENEYVKVVVNEDTKVVTIDNQTAISLTDVDIINKQLQHINKIYLISQTIHDLGCNQHVTIHNTRVSFSIGYIYSDKWGSLILHGKKKSKGPDVMACESADIVDSFVEIILSYIYDDWDEPFYADVDIEQLSVIMKNQLPVSVDSLTVNGQIIKDESIDISSLEFPHS